MKKTLKMLSFLTCLVLTLTAVFCAVAEEKTYTVGIGQFAEHGSLDNCRTGFLEGLAEVGIEEGKNLTVIYQNAQADMGITQQIAAQFAAKPVDLMVGIATPMAQACYNAAAGAIPTIYTAVSDPVAAGFADADGKATGNATGTSDALPVAAQLEMIRALMPEAKAIGILYTTSEVNSLSTIEIYKSLAGDYGFEIVESGVSTSADIPLALDALLPKVDCLTNLTDNTVVNALALVLDKANAAGKPVYGSEIEQVKLGCAAAEGLDYVALGRQTGLMVMVSSAIAAGTSAAIMTRARNRDRNFFMGIPPFLFFKAFRPKFTGTRDYLMPICSMLSARKRWVKMNMISMGAAVSRQPAMTRVATFSGLEPICVPAREDKLARSRRMADSATMIDRSVEPRNCLDR